MTTSEGLLLDAERVRARACLTQARALDARARAMDIGTDNLQWRLETQMLVLRYRQLFHGPVGDLVGTAVPRHGEIWSVLGDAARRARTRLAMVCRQEAETRRLEEVVRRNASRARRQHIRLEAYYQGGGAFFGEAND